MGLRARLALILAAAIIPLSLGFSAWRITSVHRDLMERRADRFAARMQRAPDGCPQFDRPERRPDRRRRGRGEFRPHLYSIDLVPHRSAPPFPTGLRSVLNSDDPVHVWRLPGEDTMGATAVKLADSGDCAVAVIPWNSEAIPPTAIREAAKQTIWLALTLAILGILISMPIVRRIRRLEDAVRRASDGEFEAEIGGKDEIAALANAFRETLAAVREREQALEEYIANTTHDLAIPLTVLQHRLKKASESSPSDDLRVALEESHYISNLIANMRAAAKLEAGTALDLSHTVDLAEIVERVAQRHQPIAAQRDIELNFGVPSAPTHAAGEPTLLEQALSNLVQNAVQYNAPGGHVSIVLEDLGANFEIIVADDGPGIPKDARGRVMERGVRDDDARSRNEGGQGFGLAIVKRVVELHAWDIALEGDDGLIVRVSGPRTSADRSP